MPDLSMFDLTGKKALVTGGNSGIGLGIAEGLAQSGAQIAICGSSKEKNKIACERLSKIHPDCKTFAFDLENTGNIESFFQTALNEMKEFDILVNNAGIQCRGRADQVAVDDFERTLRINLIAPYMLSQCFARERMEKKKGGAIIMIASLMSEASRPGTSAYTATKGGIRQLVKALAVDWAAFGIRVNGIGPGYIRTGATKVLYDNPDFNQWVVKRTPQQRWGVPDDLAGAAVFLASRAADFITGQILYVDGGWLATF